MGKNRVAYYLPNKGYTNVDFSDYKNANPGIGGSEYAVLLIADELARCSTKLEVFLFVDKKCDNLKVLNSNLCVVEVTSQNDTLDQLHKNAIKYFIYCYGYFDNNDFWRGLNEETEVVVLCECFLPYKKLAEYTNNPKIARIIAVGREQLDLYRDHAAFNKSDYIFNPITTEQIDNAKKCYSEKRRDKSVVFMGSLTPAKSFDVLAKAWPNVIKRVPDATLDVIGGGNLYNRDWKLGQWGLAEESFENSFMKPLLDDNGKILQSVKFWGVLGSEKNQILRSACVGVPNPTGKTETYGFVAVEMQMAGCLIATMKCPGFLDTVVCKQSILYGSPAKLARSIVLLLSKKNDTFHQTIHDIDLKFNLTKIGAEWEKLLTECIPYGQYLHDHNKLENANYAFKWLREINRKIKGIIPGGETLPSLLFYEYALFKLKIRRPYYLKF